LNRKNAGAFEPRLAFDPASDWPRIVEERDQSIPRLPTIGIRSRFQYFTSAHPIWMIWFSRSHTCVNSASESCPSECALAPRNRQSNDFG